MRCQRQHKAQHLIGHSAYLPLGAVAAAQIEEILQAAAVHRHDHLGLTGIGQHKARILIGLLGGLGAGGLFRKAIGHKACRVGILQCTDERKILFGVLVHRGNELRLGLRDSLNLRRNDIAEIVQPDIALTLYAEAADAVARYLCQKGARHALDAKGEACMLDRAGMAEIRQLLQEGRRLFRCQTVKQRFNMCVRVAKLRRRGNRFLGVICMGNELN